MKQKQPSISIPKYKQPETSTFDLFGTQGVYNKGSNTFSVSDPTEAATMNDVKSIRADLLKSLGVGGSVSESPYTQTYMNEILRLAQPKTENALIGRGLGGSSVYKDAITDLMTKAAVQSILGGQQYNMNNLNAYNDYLNSQNTIGQNLLTMVMNQNDADQNRYLKQYMSLLPYKSQVNTGTNFGGLGSLLGTGAGALLALPTGGMSVLGGAALGGALGGGLGGLF